MSKTILLIGTTDGIGLETANLLVSQGHTVLIHGRNAAKLEAVEQTLAALPQAGPVESYVADLANEWLAQQGLLSIRDLWMKAQGYV